MSRQKHIRRLVLSLLASTAIPTSGVALEASGTAVQVSPAANAAGPGGDRILQAPGDIFQDDLITTDTGGQAQIRFRDNTRFVVGPNSKVTIDRFVFNPDGTASDVVFAAVKGTFRFIGGNSNDDAYSIRTPTMTIGIRGTAGDFAVRPGGMSMVLWHEGLGTSCVVPADAPVGARTPTECRDLEPGDFLVAPPGGGFSELRPGEEAVLINTFLPYAGSDVGLGEDFVLPIDGRPPPPPPPGYTRPPSNYQQ